MARILFTTTLGAANWAGSEVLWFKAASMLAEQGHQLAVVLPKQMDNLQNRERLAGLNIQMLGQPFDRLRSVAVRLARRQKAISPTLFAPVVQHAKRWKADVVIFSQASCWGSYSEMLALKKVGIPYISISQLNSPFAWLGDQLYEAVGDAFAGARAAVFVSEGNLKLLQNQIARELDNAHVIYNPPSFDVSQPCAPVEDREGLRLLNVARVDPAHKGQDVLLDVLALEKWRQREVVLQIAGGGQHKWMEALIESKGLTGRVELLGHVHDLKAVWETTTFGIFPSRYEGMPLALIEGMSLGRSAIATDVAGHSEWIQDQSNGFIAAGCEQCALDEALERAWLCRANADRLGALARATAISMLKDDPVRQLARLIMCTS